MTSGLLILLRVYQNVMNGFTVVFSEFSKSHGVYNHAVKQTSCRVKKQQLCFETWSVVNDGLSGFPVSEKKNSQKIHCPRMDNFN